MTNDLDKCLDCETAEDTSIVDPGNTTPPPMTEDEFNKLQPVKPRELTY